MGSQASEERLAEQNSFHMFKTKANFMEALNRREMVSISEDDASVCSIEAELHE